MSVVLTTYSAKDLNFSLSSPLLAEPIQIAGVNEQGMNKVTVRMTQDQTTMKVGADGAVMPSAIPGDQGEFEIQVLQTGTLHQLFLEWYNQLKAARDAGDVTNWASSTVYAQNTVLGTSHTGTGVAPTKVPDIEYGAEGATITWILRAANIVNQ